MYKGFFNQDILFVIFICCTGYKLCIKAFYRYMSFGIFIVLTFFLQTGGDSAQNRLLPGNILAHQATKDALACHLIQPVCNSQNYVSVYRHVWRSSPENLHDAWNNIVHQRHVADNIVAQAGIAVMFMSSLSGIFSHPSHGQSHHLPVYPGITYWIVHDSQMLNTIMLKCAMENQLGGVFSTVKRNTGLYDAATMMSALCRTLKDHRSTFMQDKLSKIMGCVRQDSQQYVTKAVITIPNAELSYHISFLQKYNITIEDHTDDGSQTSRNTTEGTSGGHRAAANGSVTMSNRCRIDDSESLEIKHQMTAQSADETHSVDQEQILIDSDEDINELFGDQAL